MKKFRRIVSLTLALLTVLSCVGAGAFAASESLVKQYGVIDKETGYGGYLVIGDSIARGTNEGVDLSKGYDYNFTRERPYYNYALRNVEGSFPWRVAKAVGCTMPEKTVAEDDGNGHPASYWPVCFTRHSLHGTMKLLLDLNDGWEGKYDPLVDSGAYLHREEMLDYYNNPKREYMMFSKLIENAALITIEQGMSDVIYRSTDIAEDEFGGMDLSVEFVGRVVELMYEGFEYWKNAYPILLGYINDVNPNAVITMVGSFNMFQGLRVSDDMILPLGNALAAITDLMNQYYRKWEKEFKNCVYIDITNVETPAGTYGYSLTSEEFSDGDLQNLAIHPSVEGDAYIARQILAALSEIEIAEPVCPIFVKADTDIKLDLGRFTKVSYVMVDNKKASDYGFYNENNPFELTVRCNRRTAKLLTVAVDQGGGKIALYTYLLSFRDGEYSAYKLYNTDSALKTATILVKEVGTVGSKILKAFGSLFKK